MGLFQDLVAQLFVLYHIVWEQIKFQDNHGPLGLIGDLIADYPAEMKPL